MAAIESSWVLGEIRFTEDVTFFVSSEPCTITAGNYYLWDADESISLVHQLVAAVEASEIISADTLTIFVRRDRKVEIVYDFNDETIPSLQLPEPLATAIGFESTEYGEATSFVGSKVPTLLWSPGWPETTIGHPVGTEGFDIPNWEQTSSASGLTVRTTVHGTSQVATELFWDWVKQARVWTTSDGEPGEFRRFWRDVLVPGYRWKLYSGITEDEVSSTEVTWTTAVGPYKVREIDPRWWSRSIKNVDSHTPITLKGTKTSEISN